MCVWEGGVCAQVDDAWCWHLGRRDETGLKKMIRGWFSHTIFDTAFSEVCFDDLTLHLLLLPRRVVLVLDPNLDVHPFANLQQEDFLFDSLLIHMVLHRGYLEDHGLGYASVFMALTGVAKELYGTSKCRHVFEVGGASVVQRADLGRGYRARGRGRGRLSEGRPTRGPLYGARRPVTWTFYRLRAVICLPFNFLSPGDAGLVKAALE